MIRVIVILTILFNMGYAGGNKYFIKLGSFKNLQGLEKSVGTLPYALRSHVVVVHKNSWYIPFAYYTSNRRTLSSKVAGYKRYFPDAHIAQSRAMFSYPIVHNYTKKKSTQRSSTYKKYVKPVQYTRPTYRASRVQPQYSYASQNYKTNNYGTTTYAQNNTRTMSPSYMASLPLAKTIPMGTSLSTYGTTTSLSYAASPQTKMVMRTKKVVHDRYHDFKKEMLSGHHYYLAYKGSETNPNLLIKVSFGNHQVTYQPIIGDMQMTKANYVAEDGKLYMFANSFARNGSYSKLEEHRDNHFLVSSWINGEKLNTLRYYYTLNDAKEYLGLKKSSGLSNTLQEGKFDEFFLDED